MAKKIPLPEVIVNSGKLVDLSKAAYGIRAQLAQVEGEEKENKECLASEGGAVRLAELGKGNYIGLVRVVDESPTAPVKPTQVQFTMNSSRSQMPMTAEPDMQKTLGTCYPFLFDKRATVAAGSDLMKVMKDIIAKNLDPLAYLNISVKGGMDEAVKGLSTHVVMEERIVPQEDFLNKLNDCKNALSEDGKEFIKTYLNDTLDTKVALGPKGKA